MRARLLLSLLLAVLVGCTGEAQVPPSSFLKADAGAAPDAGTVIARDGGTVATMDAGPRADAGLPRDGGELQGPTMQIIAVRLSPPGPQAPSLPVSGVFVTYVRAALGDDPAGFFVQFARTGPALFVATDPAALTPAPTIGDEVAFAVGDTEVVDAQHRVLNISSWNVLSSGNDTTPLIQDLSAATDVVTALSTYESEIVTIDATIAGPSSPAGAGHRRALLATVGLPSETQLVLRAEESLFDGLGLAEGCDVSVGPIAMWRFQTTAQILALSADDITVSGCANGPRLLSARSTNDTTVEVTFDRPMDSATTVPGAFTIVPALTINGAATVDNVVTLTTATMGELAPYTVTAADTVADTLGNTIDTTANSAAFVGPNNAVTPTSAGEIIFTEIMQNPSARLDVDAEYLEVHNTTGVTLDLAGCRILDLGVDDHAIGTPVVIAAGGYATLARGAMPGFVPDYVYTNITLGNATDRIVLDCFGTEIDRVEWDGGATFPDPNGASMNLDPSNLNGAANDIGSNWCEASTVFAVDLGTPGSPNDVCMVVPPPDAGIIDAGNFDGGLAPDGGVIDAGSTDAGPAPAAELIINEVDYDTPGIDNMEFVELYNASAAPVNMTGRAVVFVNGATNGEYQRVVLTGTLAAGAYLLIANAAVVAPAGVTVLTIPGNGVQNGGPDGLALIDVANSTVLDAISYEGSITNANINGFGAAVSLVEGTAATAVDNNQTITSIGRSPNGFDTNDASIDWVATATPTPGLPNVP